jgi:hypothetical protein
MHFKTQKMINETLLFHTCGICGLEFGLRDMCFLSELSWELDNSDLSAKCFELKKAGRDFENVGNYSLQKVLLTNYLLLLGLF